MLRHFLSQNAAKLDRCWNVTRIAHVLFECQKQPPVCNFSIKSKILSACVHVLCNVGSRNTNQVCLCVCVRVCFQFSECVRVCVHVLSNKVSIRHDRTLTSAQVFCVQTGLGLCILEPRGKRYCGF
jgi:hypothetical protein